MNYLAHLIEEFLKREKNYIAKYPLTYLSFQKNIYMVVYFITAGHNTQIVFMWGVEREVKSGVGKEEEMKTGTGRTLTFSLRNQFHVNELGAMVLAVCFKSDWCTAVFTNDVE